MLMTRMQTVLEPGTKTADFLGEAMKISNQWAVGIMDPLMFQENDTRTVGQYIIGAFIIHFPWKLVPAIQFLLLVYQMRKTV